METIKELKNKAKNTLKGRTTESLLEMLEALDTGMNENGLTEETLIVEWWIFDEIEERFPKAFDAWMESGEDGKLGKYIKEIAA